MMGTIRSRPSETTTTATTLPPPYYVQSLWQVVCRPCGKQNAFNGPHPLLLQPDARLFCVKGLRCPQLALAQAEKAVPGRSPLRETSPEVAAAQRHCELYLHASKATIQGEARDASPTAVVNAPALTVDPIAHRRLHVHHRRPLGDKTQSARSYKAILLDRGRTRT